MTRRVCRALAHPRVHVLAHPTGRLIGKRAPSMIDFEAVLRAARRHDKALEVNAHPERLDLDDVHARRAHELGRLVAVSTDTHVLDDLACMELGVATARRGWTEKHDVLNTWRGRPPRLDAAPAEPSGPKSSGVSARRTRTSKEAAAARRVLRLRREIRRHDRLYYEEARPEISDA